MNKRNHLVFQMWSGDGGLFFDETDFNRLRQIARAINDAKNWGDFRILLPEGEFESLGLWWCNDGENIYRDGDHYLFIDNQDLPEFWRACGEKNVIDRDAPFDADRLPGLPDGDYPPWLFSTAVERSLLPDFFVDQYGQWAQSPIYGEMCTFPTDKLVEMRRALEAAGFLVTENLSFDL